MSKIVVGMKSQPAIIPQRIDCGFRTTTPNAAAASCNQSSRLAAGGDSGSRKNRSALIAKPRIPMPAQNAVHVMPAAISGPTRN